MNVLFHRNIRNFIIFFFLIFLYQIFFIGNTYFFLQILWKVTNIINKFSFHTLKNATQILFQCYNLQFDNQTSLSSLVLADNWIWLFNYDSICSENFYNNLGHDSMTIACFTIFTICTANYLIFPFCIVCCLEQRIGH